MRPALGAARSLHLPKRVPKKLPLQRNPGDSRGNFVNPKWNFVKLNNVQSNSRSATASVPRNTRSARHCARAHTHVTMEPPAEPTHVEAEQEIRAGQPYRMMYATTQRKSEKGKNWRTVLPLRMAPVHETAMGKRGDNTWGWWMREGTQEKWFALKYIITVAAISVEEARSYEDCPQELRRRSGRGRSASPTGGSGSRSRSRSRSGSRSPTFA